MKHYFAPLEGITDSIYRKLHCQFFPVVDRYYTPFFSPTVHRALTAREQRELPEADALPVEVVPQILTKNSTDFLWMAEQCAQRGYREVNLNAGCPSGTVTAKGKGAGMLQDLDALDRFLEEIFRSAPLDISVKTRLGVTSAEEFPAILEIYNRYPIKELTIHPRVRKAFYSGHVDMQAFSYAYANSKAPLCFNGDLCSQEDIAMLTQKFPDLQAVMLGRGLVADPGMLSNGGTSLQALEDFSQELLEQYLEAFGGSRNAMFRMKENWQFWLCRLNAPEKLCKRLRKTTELAEFRSITAEVFQTVQVSQKWTPYWQ